MTDIDLNSEPTRSLSRRRFLLGAGVAGAGIVLAACGDDDDEPAETGATTATTAAGATVTTGASEPSGDAAVVALAAGLEVLAVNTYGAALEAANSGALGAVPPAVAEYVTTAQGQHEAQLDTLNGILEGAGQPAVTTPPADLEQTVNDMFAQVTDVTGAARLALTLEEIAAQTYLAAMPDLEAPESRQLAGAICCIDRQHAAVLRFVLGEYPVPDVFAPTTEAYTG